MTLPADRCRRTDDRCRWSQAGDDGGCLLKPASPQIERLSHHNRICRGDPQPRPRPIGSPAASVGRSSPQSSAQPLTPKSP
jgi:hypothetical protein